MEKDIQEIREVLANFQEGYDARDIDQLEEFMQVFVAEGRFEVIGMDVYIKGVSKWRLTTVQVRDEGQWRFAQMTFSFPTIYPPDVRSTE